MLQKPNPNSKNKLRKALMTILYVNHGITNAAQHRPYTYVQVVFYNLGMPPETKDNTYDGFSKVSWPDAWDADRGMQVAVQHACAQAARDILARKDWLKVAKAIIKANPIKEDLYVKNKSNPAQVEA